MNPLMQQAAMRLMTGASSRLGTLRNSIFGNPRAALGAAGMGGGVAGAQMRISPETGGAPPQPEGSPDLLMQLEQHRGIPSITPNATAYSARPVVPMGPNPNTYNTPRETVSPGYGAPPPVLNNPVVGPPPEPHGPPTAPQAAGPVPQPPPRPFHLTEDEMVARGVGPARAFLDAQNQGPAANNPFGFMGGAPAPMAGGPIDLLSFLRGGR